MKCTHAWQPVSFRFETELFRISGSAIRPEIRQPDTEEGRVYVVCMKCASHSYINTKFAGFYIRPEDLTS